MTRPLVAVELQRRGMTVVMGQHGSIVTRRRVAMPTGGSQKLEHSNGAYWMRRFWRGLRCRGLNAGDESHKRAPSVETPSTRRGTTLKRRSLWQCQRQRSLAQLSAPSTISLTCRAGVGAAVQTILTAKPAVTLALPNSSATSCFSRAACTLYILD